MQEERSKGGERHSQECLCYWDRTGKLEKRQQDWLSRFAWMCGSLDFLDDLVGRKAAAFSADEWDHAIRAAAVAAVLDFQRGASVIGFSARIGAARNWVARRYHPSVFSLVHG